MANIVSEERIISIIKSILVSRDYRWQPIVCRGARYTRPARYHRRVFICVFADSEADWKCILSPAPVSPGIRAPFIVDLALSKWTRSRRLAERRMTLSAFILLPTFMCISRHDRRDNQRPLHYRECQSIVVILCVTALHCRVRAYTISVVPRRRRLRGANKFIHAYVYLRIYTLPYAPRNRAVESRSFDS